MRDARQISMFPPPAAATEDADAVSRISAVLGSELTARFAAAFAGTRIYIPTSMTPDHPIAAALGLDGAETLSRALGGERVEIPLYRSNAGRRREREEIVRLRAHGHSVVSIARALRVTERYVRKVLSRGYKQR